MKYRSKIGVLWGGSCVLMVFGTIAIMMNYVNNWGWWIGIVTMLACDLLVVNMTLDTWYTLHDDYLETKCGIFHHLKIPYQDIMSFKETHNPLASIGLSMDRIDVVFKAQNGGNGKDEMLISPVKKQEFLTILEKKTGKRRIG